MKIDLDHQYIGAAIIQIAENKNFTAINQLKIGNEPVNNGFIINGDIALLCKYASKPNKSNEYLFSFNSSQMKDIAKIQKLKSKLFFSLICIEDKEICCINKEQFNTLIENRKISAQTSEEQYQILVTLNQGERFRAYVNASGKKRLIAGEQLTIARRAFPESIFI